MKKRNLLLVLFLATINIAFSQTNNSNNTTSQPEKSPQNEVNSQKPIKVKKSTVTNNTVKVEALKLEKKESVLAPKDKVIIENKSKKKKSTKF